MSKENYFSDSSLKDKPQKRLMLTLKKGSITTDKIADDSVTHEKISANSVGTPQVIDGAVTTDKIALKAVTSAKLGDESVLISKIAQEVWDKLKDEYLRLDGGNYMKGNLFMSNGAIADVAFLANNNNSLSFVEEGYGIKATDKDGRSFGLTSFGDFKVTNESYAEGYKTNDRTNIGLLVNDGTVGLALTDSEIDGITSSVFTNYDNVTE